MQLAECFAAAKEPLLSCYLTAGYPANTEEIAVNAVEAGVAFLELGFPCSDPLADGPVIQAASAKALASGMTLSRYLATAAAIHARCEAPLVAMGYLNNFAARGPAWFADAAADAGLAAVLIPDLPPNEYLREWRESLTRRGLGAIFLITPQTPLDRVRLLDELSEGFLYVVPRSSTTGGRLAVEEGLRSFLAQLAEMDLRNPRVLGFGQRSMHAARELQGLISGVIIGSAFLAALEEGASPQQVRAIVSALKNGAS